MFENWMQDKDEENELIKNLSLSIGQFINPELVKKIISGPKFSSTDEEFDELSKQIVESNKNEINKNRRRKKKILINKEQYGSK